MTPVLLLMLAAMGTGPQPIGGSWFSDNDYPQAALVSGRGGAVIVTVTVSPQGRPTSCEVTRSSGFKPLDQRSCAVMMRRGQFAPAHDENGGTLTSMFTRQINWSVGAPLSVVIPVDMLVNVQHLPAGARTQPVGIRQVVGADGKIESCAIDESSKLAALDRLACEQAAGFTTVGPAKDASGASVRTLRVLQVAFADPS